MMQFGDSYGIPYYQHFGSNKTHPEPCECSEGTGHSKECNDFNFLIGAMIYDHTKNPHLRPNSTYTDLELPFVPILEFFYGGPFDRPKSSIEANDGVS